MAARSPETELSLLDELLSTVEQALVRYGRPRKNPGQPRVAAILQNGMRVVKVTKSDLDRIQRLSLPGAFQYAQISAASKSTAYSKTSVEKAKRAFYEQFTGQNGFEIGDLDQAIIRIDRNTPDTRKLQRALKATRKSLRKSVK